MGITERNFERKMNFLSRAESDFEQGKIIVPNNPVFLKYLGVTKGKKSLALIEKFKKTNKEEDFLRNKEVINETIKLFEEAQNKFPNYPELKVEYSIFLYSTENFSEGEKIEKSARCLLEEQLSIGAKNDHQIDEELKELNELKANMNLK